VKKTEKDVTPDQTMEPFKLRKIGRGFSVKGNWKGRTRSKRLFFLKRRGVKAGKWGGEVDPLAPSESSDWGDTCLKVRRGNSGREKGGEEIAYSDGRLERTRRTEGLALRWKIRQ